MQPAGYREITLRNRSGRVLGVSLVDESDWPSISAYTWSLTWDGYARRGKGGRGGRQVLMHREILGLGPLEPGGLQVDHINRSRLDNRRANLRLVTRAQQQQNYSSHQGASSRFRGVSWDRQTKRWRVHAKTDGVNRYLGSYASEVEAAFVAEKWRREHMPFAQPDPALAEIVELVRRHAA